MTIDAATTLGPVELIVGDLDAQAAFYRDAIGLRELGRDGDTVELGVRRATRRSSRSSVDPDAPPRPRGTTGLFHLALARPVARRARAGAAPGHRRRVVGSPEPPTTSSRRRSTSTTPRGTGSRSTATGRARSGATIDGELEMATLPLDLQGVLGGAAGPARPAAAWRRGRDRATCTSRSRTIPAAEAFYVGGARLRARRRAVYPGRAVRLGRRLPPPRRAQHVGRAGEHRPRRRVPAGFAGSRSSCPTTLRSSAVVAALAAAGVESRRTATALDRHRPVRESRACSRSVVSARVSSTAARACRSYWFAA